MTNEGKILTIYVPANDSHLRKTILAGSALVGSPAPNEPDLIIVDYEGNRYNFPNLAQFADKLFYAASRHVKRYPTIARVHVESSQLIPVGDYNVDTETIEIIDQSALDEWCDT